MKATATSFPWRTNAIAVAMGLTIIGLGAAIAHSETMVQPSPPVAAQSAQQATAPDFTCHAQPGAWCDLRDWSGFANAYSSVSN